MLFSSWFGFMAYQQLEVIQRHTVFAHSEVVTSIII